MDSTALNILVLDANQRSGLAVTRSIGQAFPTYRLQTADETPTALAGKSKYSSHYLQHPSPSSQPEQFIQWIKEHCANRFDLVLPTTEVTSQLLLLNAKELSGVPLAFADIETVMKVADKGNLVKEAQRTGVPVPKTDFFENSQTLNLDHLAFPAVIKPCLSKIFCGDHWIATTVRVAKSAEELKNILERDHYLAEYPFMVQEFIPGHGAGIFCLYDQGKPVQFFAHQRLREKPPEGGVSVLSQAAVVDPLLKQHAETLLSGVKWHGVAMVEFRIAEDGSPYLMEVNTRFWGSLQLSIDSGVDFPAMLVKAHFQQPVTAVHDYNHKQRLRWLLGDLDSLYIYLKGRYSMSQKLSRILNFLTPRFGHQKHEVNRLSDLGPFFEELKQYVRAF